MGKWRENREVRRQQRDARLACPLLEAGEVVEAVLWASDDAPDLNGNAAEQLVVLTNRSVLISDSKSNFEKAFRLEVRKPRTIPFRLLDAGRLRRAVSIDNRIYFIRRPSFATFHAFVAACGAGRDEARDPEQAAADSDDD